MKEKEAPVKEKYTEGRGGIKLPIIEDKYEEYFEPYDYFEEFWEINSLPNVGRDRRIIVPSSPDKPAVVISAKYKDVSDKNFMHANNAVSRIKIEGWHVHEVLLTPIALAGDFEKLFSVTRTEVSGGGHPDAFPTDDITYKGKPISAFMPQGRDYKGYVEAQKQAIREFIDLAS